MCPYVNISMNSLTGLYNLKIFVFVRNVIALLSD